PRRSPRWASRARDRGQRQRARDGPPAGHRSGGHVPPARDGKRGRPRRAPRRSPRPARARLRRLGRGYGDLGRRPPLPPKSPATAAKDVNAPPAGNVNLPGRRRLTVTVLVPSKTTVTSAGSLTEKRSGDRDARFSFGPVVSVANATVLVTVATG